jgi:hypothetical protein
MGLARDGSIGVLTMMWRRIMWNGEIYVEEGWSTRPSILYGPIPDEATCTAFIQERAKALRETVDALKAKALATYPGSFEPRNHNPLKDEESDADEPHP